MTTPSTWQGFSPRLTTQPDLLAKLQHDLSRLEHDPADEYAAWDFFVTADHMRDWEQANEREERRRDTPFLLLVGELANHGKHFRTRTPSLDQVRGTPAQAGAFASAYFDPDYFDTARLVVKHGEPAVEESALDIARGIVDFWAAELSPRESVTSPGFPARGWTNDDGGS